MFKDYYKRELSLLRETAALFANENPTIAGGLRNASSDPDVERLLEGFAFLAANIHQELDDHYPRLLHTLAQVISPQYLRPLPSATLIEFEPRPSLQQTLRVKRGAHIDGAERGSPGTNTCRYRTCVDVDVHPLRVNRVFFQEQETGQTQTGASLVLRLDVLNTTLAKIQMQKLRLFLGGSFAEATDMLYLLRHFLTGIELRGPHGELLQTLAPSQLTHGGFAPEEALLSDRPRHLPAFEILREYFLFPEKFLFLDLDVGDWQHRPEINSFDIVFRCRKPDCELPRVRNDSVLLHTTPAVNLFRLEADPVVLSQREGELRVTPAMQGGSDVARTARVYSVDSVEGIVRGRSERRRFSPLSGANLESNQVARYVVQTRMQEALGRTETWITPVIPPHETVYEREVLKIDLTCTNGDAVERLQRGDICQSTGETPELVSFRNVSVPTKNLRPTLDGDLMWSLLSDLSMNYASLADLASFKAMLLHYLPGRANDDARVSAAARRIDAIEQLVIQPDHTLYRGAFIRGQRIHLKVRGDHFSGEGDKYLFGCVIDYLFASTCGFNTFTALNIEDFHSGAVLSWPIRLGLKTLV